MIRLRDIAKHLPFPIQDAVAAAVIYDPPSPHQPADGNAELTEQQPQQQQQQQQRSSDDARQDPLDAAASSMSQSAASQSQPAEFGCTMTAALAAQGAPCAVEASAADTKHFQDALTLDNNANNAASIAAVSGIKVGLRSDKESEEACLSKSHVGPRQLQVPEAKQAQRGSRAPGSAVPVWRNPTEMTPREVALEKLLVVKLSQAVPDQERPVSSGGSQHAGQKAVSFGHPSTASKRKTISAQPTKRTSTAIVSALPLATALFKSHENAEQGKACYQNLGAAGLGSRERLFSILILHTLAPENCVCPCATVPYCCMHHQSNRYCIFSRTTSFL